MGLQDHVKRIDEEEVVAEGDGLDLNHLLVEILKIDLLLECSLSLLGVLILSWVEGKVHFHTHQQI